MANRLSALRSFYACKDGGGWQKNVHLETIKSLFGKRIFEDAIKLRISSEIILDYLRGHQCSYKELWKRKDADREMGHYEKRVGTRDGAAHLWAKRLKKLPQRPETGGGAWDELFLWTMYIQHIFFWIPDLQEFLNPRGWLPSNSFLLDLKGWHWLREFPNKMATDDQE